MYNPEHVKIGDILCYKTEGFDPIGELIKLFSGAGKYSHTSIYIGNGRIIESHIDTGVVEKELNPKWYKKIDMYRHKKILYKNQPIQKLRDELRTSFIYYAKSYIGCTYDIGAFPATFVHSTIGKIFNSAELQRATPWLNDKNSFYCSELVAKIYLDCGLNIDTDLNWQSVTPSDIGRSKELVRII